MDSITHTLFGLSLYGASDRSRMTRREKAALLAVTLVGSQVPDIDVISSWWDTAGRYQMWHRGLTHSVFLVPVWAGVIAYAAGRLFKTGARRWFGIAALAAFIHGFSDLFNAWGTGYFEPFSNVRVTFGTIPIVDFVYWAFMLGGALFVRYGRTRFRSHTVFRAVWLLMALHVAAQSVQGAILYRQAEPQYDQVALSAGFVPGQFTVIGKKGDQVVLSRGNVSTGTEPEIRLTSREEADLDRLFEENPKARTLYEWSPFVVVVDDGKRLGIYDPRFYRDGQSFLFESISTGKME